VKKKFNKRKFSIETKKAHFKFSLTNGINAPHRNKSVFEVKFNEEPNR
jgi:hypothetical protein